MCPGNSNSCSFSSLDFRRNEKDIFDFNAMMVKLTSDLIVCCCLLQSGYRDVPKVTWNWGYRLKEIGVAVAVSNASHNGDDFLIFSSLR